MTFTKINEQEQEFFEQSESEIILGKLSIWPDVLEMNGNITSILEGKTISDFYSSFNNQDVWIIKLYNLQNIIDIKNSLEKIDKIKTLTSFNKN